MLAKFIRMRTARSHPRGARSACVERSTEGINQYQEQSLIFSVPLPHNTRKNDRVLPVEVNPRRSA
ncbi:MAG: hypothetical protein E7057_11180 [Lentisphaerae bacterium]|nr:hypothetical protein [Lentisphaerota bacterium]